MKNSLPAGFMSGWWLILLSSVALVFLAALPPFIPESARFYLMEAFSGVCHQLSDRSIHVGGVSLAVCHRCFGTYVGLLAAALLFLTLKGLWPFTRKMAPWILFASVLPAVVDWSGDVLGFWTNTPTSRMITGGILGVTAGYFLVAAVVDAFVARRKKSG